jgi:hypothetical protein
LRRRAGSGAKETGRRETLTAIVFTFGECRRRDWRREPQQFWGLEQKENISLTTYVGFPVAPTFMIWSSDLGSGWIRWPHDSTALSTRIIPDDAARSHWPMLEQRGEWLAIYAE